MIDQAAQDILSPPSPWIDPLRLARPWNSCAAVPLAGKYRLAKDIAEGSTFSLAQNLKYVKQFQQ